MIADMDTPIIVAIIGAVATVLAGLLQLRKETRQFRRESSDQHGALMTLVKMVADATDEIEDDLKDLKRDLADHISNHDAKASPPAKKTVRRTPPKQR